MQNSIDCQSRNRAGAGASLIFANLPHLIPMSAVLMTTADTAECCQKPKHEKQTFDLQCCSAYLVLQSFTIVMATALSMHQYQYSTLKSKKLVTDGSHLSTLQGNRAVSQLLTMFYINTRHCSHPAILPCHQMRCEIPIIKFLIIRLMRVI